MLHIFDQRRKPRIINCIAIFIAIFIAIRAARTLTKLSPGRALSSATRNPLSKSPPSRHRPGNDHYRSKSVAAWLALLLGTLGVHRMYLYGLRDFGAWLFPLPTALGLLGVQRLRTLGQDDTLAWILLPVLGLMISLAMMSSIVYALTADEKWDRIHNPQREPIATGWAPVLAAVAALFVGGMTLMGTVAYSGQRFFEWQLQDERAARDAARATARP